MSNLLKLWCLSFTTMSVDQSFLRNLTLFSQFFPFLAVQTADCFWNRMNNSGVAEPCDSLSNPDLMQPLSFLYEIILVVWQAMRYLEFYMIHAKVCLLKKMEVKWKLLEVLNAVWGGNDNMDNVSFFFLNEWHSSHNVVFFIFAMSRNGLIVI